MSCPDCIPTFTALNRLRECKILQGLRSNYAPDTFGRTQLNQLVLQAENEFTEYDKAIAKLHETILFLQNEKKYLKRQVRLAQSLMAPIRKLPPEILREIFIAHVVVQGCVISPAKCVVPGFEIASVCSQWRSLALCTTALWNSITVKIRQDCGYPGIQWSQLHVSLVEHLLKLSGKSHLSITMDLFNVTIDIPAPPFLSLLCEQADRWTSLKGSSHSYRRIPTFLNAFRCIQGRLYHLHTLRFSHLFHFNDLVDGAPKLRSLLVSSLPETGNTSIPWKQLCFLEVRHSGLDQVLRILPDAPGLQALTVGYFPTQRSGLEVGQLVHSNLTTLKFGLRNNNDSENVAKALDLLNLPKLQFLSIIAYYPSDNGFPGGYEQFSSFLLRSLAITTFILDKVWVSTNDLILILQGMPSLTEMSLSEATCTSRPPMLSDELLLSLSISANTHSDRQPLLARISSLTLKGHLLSFDTQLFVDLIQSRWKPSGSLFTEDEPSCIKNVRLQIQGGEINPDMAHPLIILEERGLNVAIIDKHGDVLARARLADESLQATP